MAEMAYSRLTPERRQDVTALIGGLGAGHTLRATLDLPGVTAVEVIEVSAKMEEWNHRYFGEVNGDAIKDPRVKVIVADLATEMKTSRGVCDISLLDVDNGPGWLAAPGNAWLYRKEGLRACAAAVRPGGILAIWSPAANPQFLTNLVETFGGDNVEEVINWNPEGDENGPGDVIYIIPC